jgi:hypothetical protein
MTRWAPFLSIDRLRREGFHRLVGAFGWSIDWLGPHSFRLVWALGVPLIVLGNMVVH